MSSIPSLVPSLFQTEPAVKKRKSACSQLISSAKETLFKAKPPSRACLSRLRARFKQSKEQALKLEPVSIRIDAPSVVKADSIRGAFEKNFLRRVRGEEREALIQGMKRFEGFQASKELLTALKKGDWSSDFFLENDWPLIALVLYARGEVDEFQVAKLFLFDECRALSGFEHHTLNDPKEFELLREGMKDLPLGDRIFELGKLPPEERQFFTFRVPLLSREAFGAVSCTDVDIFNAMHYKDILLNTHIRPDLEKKELQVFAIPPCLQYEINRLVFGEKTAFPELVLGYDSQDRMEDPKRRILCVPCRYILLPQFIHDFYRSKRLGMYVHDQHHLIFDSANPHREAWIELSKKFRDGDVGDRLNDRAFIAYLNKLRIKLETPEEMFWTSLLRLLRGQKESPEVLSYILSKEKEWGPKYNLSLASLEECYAKEPPEVGLYSLKLLLEEIQGLTASGKN